MISFFKTTVYIPLYNALIFIVEHIPHADLGVAVILLTVIVKLILFPLTYKATRTQMKLRELQPQIDALRTQYPDRMIQAQKLMELYKSNKINPFGGLLPTLIQIPIFISLYFIPLRSGLPTVNGDYLYSFISSPDTISMSFLGFVDIASKSVILAALVAITQIIQVQLTFPAVKRPENRGGSMKDELMWSLSFQTRYIFPLMTGYIAYITSGAVALYLITSNLFAIGQELYIRRKIRKEKAAAGILPA